MSTAWRALWSCATLVAATPACSVQVSSAPSGLATASPAVLVATPGSCHARGSDLYVLPDPSYTPGATNPKVTQATIGVSICQSGWTATVRPPASYTNHLKLEQMAAYGWAGPPSDYEEDHLVPLELGGAPRDPANLWPEPGERNNPKDKVENAAKRAVCGGNMQLADAQQAIAADWVSFGRQLGVMA